MFVDEKATAAWKSGEEMCNAVNSHNITARLKFDPFCVGIQDIRSRYGHFMSIISVYAPTYRPSVSTIKAFYETRS